MATTDDIKVRISVDGTAQIKEAGAAAEDLGKKTETTRKKMTESEMAIRNFSYQVQDMAVQFELGTNAFRVFGQQLPQLLGSLGTLGVVIGGVVGVGFPLLSLGLKIAGVDMRNLKERTDDLTEATKNYKDAQAANLPTVEGLRDKYGALAEEAKKYLEATQQLGKIQSLNELSATLVKVLSNFTTTSQDLQQILETSQGITFEDAAMSASVLGASVSLLALQTGLSSKNAEILSDKLKTLNKDSKPEQVLAVVRDISEWLAQSGMESANIKRVFDEVVKPLQTTADAALRIKENVQASSQAASNFSAVMLKLQNLYLPGVNEARRNFDQILAAGRESKLKLEEFNAQVEKRRADGQKVTQAEIDAFRKRNQQEYQDKVKDIKKAQDEAFNSSELTNESKKRALELETNLLTIQDNKRYFLAYEIQYEEDLARNRKEQKDTLSGIAEQLRKRVITTDQALALEQEAYDIRRRADDVAERTRLKRKNDAADAQQQVLFEGDARRRAVEFDIKAFEIRQKMRNAYPEDIDHEVNVAKIKNDQFEAEMKINREMETGKISRQDALERIAKTNDEMTRLLELERERTKEAQRYRTASFGEGATDAVSKIIRDNLTAYQKAGKMVESVYANMGTAIDNFVESGKFKFSDFTRSVINDLIKIQLKADITSVLGAGLRFLGFNLPGRAAGGPVSGNSPYIVGEHGPELFIPRTAGNIIPNGSTVASSAATSITYNINAVDTTSFKQLIARDPSFIYAVTEQGRKNIPQVRR